MSHVPEGSPSPGSAADAALSMPLPGALPASGALETAGEDDVRFVRGPRSYRVRGLSRNLSAETLKITLRVSSGERLHLDTLDLYLARARASFAKAAALGLASSPHQGRSELENPADGNEGDRSVG